MAIVTRGFRSRRKANPDRLPPGQYQVNDFPVLSAGPTPHVAPEEWRFTITSESGAERSWTWQELLALPAESPTIDIHCVTKWSKLDSRWTGVPIDAFMADIDTAARFALVYSYGGYTTNLPLADLLDGKAWIAYQYEGAPLAAVHGGPARLLVPHLYFWKSAKWVRGIRLLLEDDAGFWESLGYHDYGDPWREQRYAGD